MLHTMQFTLTLTIQKTALSTWSSVEFRMFNHWFRFYYSIQILLWKVTFICVLCINQLLIGRTYTKKSCIS
jgi:hypothetical protein